jgi:aminocarboxymuconate-semialdehyde decarboxylase
MKQPASAYLRRFHYDVILFNAQIMRDLINLVGVDRVVMGTDYPQGMAVKQPVDFVESVPGLSLREREMILSTNAQRLFHL